MPSPGNLGEHRQMPRFQGLVRSKFNTRTALISRSLDLGTQQKNVKTRNESATFSCLRMTGVFTPNFTLCQHMETYGVEQDKGGFGSGTMTKVSEPYTKPKTVLFPSSTDVESNKHHHNRCIRSRRGQQGLDLGGRLPSQQ